jgi:hypothetical protein
VILQIFQGVGPSTGTKKEGTADVFSRRHTQSKVYWQTGKDKTKGAAGVDASGLQKQGSVDLKLLKESQQAMEPSELIKVSDAEVSKGGFWIMDYNTMFSASLLLVCDMAGPINAPLLSLGY